MAAENTSWDVSTYTAGHRSMSYDIISNNAPAFTLEGTQCRCASSNELSIRSVTMSDIDAEDVVEPSRLVKQMQLRRVLLPYRSPSAKDTRLRSLKRLLFSSIGGNGVTLNGIVTRGNEGF
jgi:hypothetical protein